jgi:EamA domain-containing membrane protein RarD
MKALEIFFFRNIWVFCFIVATIFIYERHLKLVKQDESALLEQLQNIQREMDFETTLQQKLRLQVFSQKDRDSIELVLLRKLGLIPEGYTKYLIEDNE